MLKDALLKVKILDGTELDKRLTRSTVKFENDLTVTLPNSLIHFEEKVVIPKFVADWIEVCKEHLTSSLYLAMTPSFLKANNQGIELTIWIKKNEETFALAWINGYEVEQEKRYSVKIKGKVEENLLVYGLGINRYFFARTYDSSKRNGHTRKELEEDGFGWVFDCPGVEVEEAEP